MLLYSKMFSCIEYTPSLLEYFPFFLICSSLFSRSENSSKMCLIVIQCDSGHVNGDLIACARHRICNMRAKARTDDSITHVLIIVHLPVHTVNLSFVGFQSEPWISYHIDKLRAGEMGDIGFEYTQETSISKIFLDEVKGSGACYRLNRCIPAAASRLQDLPKNKYRAAKRVELLINAIPRDPKFPLGECVCYFLLMLTHL